MFSHRVFVLSIIACLAGCAASPTEEGRQPDEVRALDGTSSHAERGQTEVSATGAHTALLVDGEPFEVSLDGGALRLAGARQTIILRRDGDARVVVSFDDAGRGEQATFAVPRHDAGVERAIADTTGTLEASTVERHGRSVPIAAYAIAAWPEASRHVADELLTSWVASFASAAAAAHAVVQPRMFDDFMLAEETGSAGGFCSASSTSGASCSVSCTRGTPHCETSPYAVSCTCR